MPSDGAELAKILVYLPAFVMGAYLIFGLLRLYRNTRAEPETVSAVVLEKRISRVRYASNKIRFPRKAEYNHYVSFQRSDGKIVEMLVTEEVHNCLREGKQGFLTYRGTDYIHFEEKI